MANKFFRFAFMFDEKENSLACVERFMSGINFILEYAEKILCSVFDCTKN